MNFRSKPRIPTNPVPAPRNGQVAGMMTNKIESFNKPKAPAQDSKAQASDSEAPKSVQDIMQKPKTDVPQTVKPIGRGNVMPMSPESKKSAIARMIKKGGN